MKIILMVVLLFEEIQDKDLKLKTVESLKT